MSSCEDWGETVNGLLNGAGRGAWSSPCVSGGWGGAAGKLVTMFVSAWFPEAAGGAGAGEGKGWPTVRQLPPEAVPDSLTDPVGVLPLLFQVVVALVLKPCSRTAAEPVSRTRKAATPLPLVGLLVTLAQVVLFSPDWPEPACTQMSYRLFACTVMSLLLITASRRLLPANREMT